jgi:hypothetical protein
MVMNLLSNTTEQQQTMPKKSSQVCTLSSLCSLVSSSETQTFCQVQVIMRGVLDGLNAHAMTSGKLSERHQPASNSAVISAAIMAMNFGHLTFLLPLFCL